MKMRLEQKLGAAEEVSDAVTCGRALENRVCKGLGQEDLEDGKLCVAVVMGKRKGVNENVGGGGGERAIRGFGFYSEHRRAIGREGAYGGLGLAFYRKPRELTVTGCLGCRASRPLGSRVKPGGMGTIGRGM